MMLRLLALALSLSLSDGFNAAVPLSRQARAFSPSPKVGTPAQSSPLFQTQRLQVVRKDDLDIQDDEQSPSLLRRVLNRFDTVEAAGLEDAKLSGLSLSSVVKRITSLHNPITYIVLVLAAGCRWQWCFRSPFYWLAFAFTVKWYRARYVFKIPVWDRQPNWNNVITSKDQEKDLKAFTCKNCGSTLFIAKTREFFFEGDTGIGGLGCFSCGIKGKENFIQDRDRIVEDVADIDDYFEYERPLDFVSAAERRKLLKESGGDEAQANKLLATKGATDAAEEPAINGEDAPEAADTAEVDEEEATVDKVVAPESVAAPAEPVDVEAIKSEPVASEEKPKKKKKKPKKKVPKQAAPEPPSDDLDDFDALDMDDF
jgi:hypothetical protein